MRTDHRALQYIYEKKPQENASLTRWGMYWSAYDFDISFLPGDGTLMRQSDWLSRDGCEPISEDCLKQSRYMSPQERSKQEMECDDCRSGTVSKATHRVSASRALQRSAAEWPTRVPALPTRGAASTAIGKQLLMTP